uniref:Carrier domain-containing protein n=4 Tax=Streptomyces TaxID=1883 RepID=R9UR18_STRGD|nr:hypothetical protein [Streptomyces griseoviridis]
MPGMNKTIPQTPEELREVLAGLIGVEPADIRDDSVLFELGLDSVTALMLINSWRRAGLSSPSQEFIDAPTVGHWWNLIATS